MKINWFFILLLSFSLFADTNKTPQVSVFDDEEYKNRILNYQITDNDKYFALALGEELENALKQGYSKKEIIAGLKKSELFTTYDERNLKALDELTNSDDERLFDYILDYANSFKPKSEADLKSEKNYKQLLEDEFYQDVSTLYNWCVDNGDKTSCQGLIDTQILRNIAECNKQSCDDIGQIYFNVENIQQALNYFKRACELKNASSCWKIGAIYYTHHKNKDYDKSLTYLIQSCNLNYGLGCNDIGVMYENSWGVKRDYHKAKIYYERACLLKEGLGCQNLGVLYRDGKGVEVKWTTMFYYFKKACDLGIDTSCDFVKYVQSDSPDIAALLYAGNNDSNNALKYFQKVCDNGDKAGCYNLATTYKSINNLKMAKKYYKIACDGGIKYACCELGQKEFCGKIRQIK